MGQFVGSGVPGHRVSVAGQEVKLYGQLVSACGQSVGVVAQNVGSKTHFVVSSGLDVGVSVHHPPWLASKRKLAAMTRLVM